MNSMKVRKQGDGAVPAAGTTAQLKAAIALSASTKHRDPSVSAAGADFAIVRTQGLHGLFSHISATMLLYSVTRLGVYEELKKRWAPENEGSVPAVTKIEAGLIAGGIGTAAVNAAVRLQEEGRLLKLVHNDTLGQRLADASFGDALVRQTQRTNYAPRQEAAQDLWRRGSTLTVQRAMMVSGLQLATYDQVKESIMQRHLVSAGIATHVAASSAAGLVTAIISNPIDIIKGRLINMLKTDHASQPAYRGALDCTLEILRTEGPLALYKGFFPIVIRQVPFTVMLFVSLEHVRYLLS